MRPRRLASLTYGRPSGRGSTTSRVVRNCLRTTPKRARKASSASTCTQASTSSSVSKGSMPVAELRQLVLDAGERSDCIFSVLRRIGLQRLLEVCADPVVVDEQSDILVIGGAVHARDGLEQLRILDEPVEIEDLLHGSVEAG